MTIAEFLGTKDSAPSVSGQCEPSKVDYRPVVERLLKHHFDMMGVRPTSSEFASIQGSIVHLLDTGSQHPDIVAADERIKEAADELANAGKPRA